MGKEDGRIVGLWPGEYLCCYRRLTFSLVNSGSTLHAVRALEHPRWEDYNYERLDNVSNRMHWLGDGQTYNEKTGTGDRECYIEIRRGIVDADFRGMVSER